MNSRRVFLPAEGREIMLQMYESGIIVPDLVRCVFRLDVSKCPSICDVENFLNSLNSFHSNIDCCLEFGRLIEFDYFISFEVLADIRELLTVYISSAHNFEVVFFQVGTFTPF